MDTDADARPVAMLDGGSPTAADPDAEGDAGVAHPCVVVDRPFRDVGDADTLASFPLLLSLTLRLKSFELLLMLSLSSAITCRRGRKRLR